MGGWGFLLMYLERKVKMSSRKGIKNKPKTAQFYLNKLKAMGAEATLVIPPNLSDKQIAIAKAKADAKATVTAPVTPPENPLPRLASALEIQPPLEPSPDDDVYNCGTCNAEVTKGVTKCDTCGEPLDWTGIS